METPTHQPPQQVYVKSGKSMGVAIILAILFGPLGLLYASVTGGIIMFVAGGLFTLVTLGFGILVTWPVCVIWAAVAVNSYNNKLSFQS